jgi:hypothetical protein
MEAGRRLEPDDASVLVRIDQPRNGKAAAATRSFASAEPRIKHGRRRDDTRP